MRLGVGYQDVGELTLPAAQLLLSEAAERRRKAMSKAKQAKAWPVVDVMGWW